MPKSDTTYQICSNCVMDTSDEHITFDRHGVCDHCRTFYKKTRPNWPTGENASRQLLQLAKKIKARRNRGDYDCIIGVSGGVDSSYLAYIAREKMNLNPLLFHVDGGWNSQIAVNNIECLVDGLDLDLHTEVINWREMRDLQVSFFKAGVSNVDTPQDHAFFAAMYKYAQENNIRNILTGSNLSTECVRNPVNWMYYQSDSWMLRDIHRIYGSEALDTFPTTSVFRHKIWLPHIKGIKVFKPLNLVNYIKKDASELLFKKFGWQAYGQKHFESRFTTFYESYWLPTRFGYDVRRVQLSSLILSGQITRQSAFNELLKPSFDPGLIEAELNYVCSKLEITREDLEAFMSMPKKTYKDFRNQKMIYDIGTKLTRFLGLDFGVKR